MLFWCWMRYDGCSRNASVFFWYFDWLNKRSANRFYVWADEWKLLEVFELTGLVGQFLQWSFLNKRIVNQKHQNFQSLKLIDYHHFRRIANIDCLNHYTSWFSILPRLILYCKIGCLHHMLYHYYVLPVFQLIPVSWVLTN